MVTIEVLGWVAASLMLATFVCREARTLRACAIMANLAFMACGLDADLHPIAALHLALLPVNVVHLIYAVREHQASDTALRERPPLDAGTAASPPPQDDAAPTPSVALAAATLRRACWLPLSAVLYVPVAACASHSNLGVVLRMPAPMLAAVQRAEPFAPIRPFDEQYVVLAPAAETSLR